MAQGKIDMRIEVVLDEESKKLLERAIELLESNSSKQTTVVSEGKRSLAGHPYLRPSPTPTTPEGETQQ